MDYTYEMVECSGCDGNVKFTSIIGHGWGKCRSCGYYICCDCLCLCNRCLDVYSMDRIRCNKCCFIPYKN